MINRRPSYYETDAEWRAAMRQLAQHLIKRKCREQREAARKHAPDLKRTHALGLGGPTAVRERLHDFGSLIRYVPEVKKTSKVNVPRRWMSAGAPLQKSADSPTRLSKSEPNDQMSEMLKKRNFKRFAVEQDLNLR